MYFNDDVYVGYVQGSDVIEIASVDPKSGPIFYTLRQRREARPKFVRQNDEQCLVCHDSAQSGDPIGRLLMLSVLPDANGTAIGAASILTTDQSPMNHRWGGWYVTGTHGKQRHLGNMVVREPALADKIEDYASRADLSTGANVTDLGSRFDVKPYLTPHSDIVALMVLAHQTHVHNLMTLALYKDQPEEQKALAERIVRTMLFVDAAPLTDRVAGPTSFAADFVKQGPRDSKGRSLRDLDLKTRLFRYPLSYLIYSKSFDGMPTAMKEYIYRRIREVLSGKDTSKDFAHLSESDRQVILEILQDTKRDFKAFLAKL